MKKKLKQLTLNKEQISKLYLDKITGGNAGLEDSRLSETCLCGSEPDNC
ncbi:hypothetical protein [uncultured Dokdonia sp.]|nr:hypothetical protein [uncultured Dokdonia sp.]